MPKATKRERQRVNKELRREAIRKAEQRQRRWRTARNVGIAVVIVAIVFGVIKLIQGDDETKSANEVTCADVKAGKGTDQKFASAPEMTVDPTSLYVAQMDTSCGTITLGLNAVQFPVAVNNFVFLAQQKFYDGLDFARAPRDFTIQGGSPNNDARRWAGLHRHRRGAHQHSRLSRSARWRWRRPGPSPTGTSGSQFFIVTGKDAQLPSGLRDVRHGHQGPRRRQEDRGPSRPASGDGTPTTTVKINKVTITVTPSATTTTAAPATTVAP